jgi:hypothetical protein
MVKSHRIGPLLRYLVMGGTADDAPGVAFLAKENVVS